MLLAEQLRQFESASADAIKQTQDTQLRTLMQHAWQYSPFWRHRLVSAGFNPALTDTSSFYHLPPLQRGELQTQAHDLRAHWPGLDPKQLITAVSSGSTGVPVRVEKDARTYMPLYSALSWTEGRWHQRDARLPIAVIGSGVQASTSDSWGSLYQMMGLKGRSEVRNAQQDTLDGHLDWLQSFRPAYLKCSPHTANVVWQCPLLAGCGEVDGNARNLCGRPDHGPDVRCSSSGSVSTTTFWQTALQHATICSMKTGGHSEIRMIKLMLTQPLRVFLLALLLSAGVLTTPAATAQDYNVETGLQAFEAQDYATALENFTQGAMLGHALAQFNLGLMYHQGIGTEQNLEDAMQLYALAAQQGIEQAQFNLGLMYDRGEGVAQDFREAYYWYMQAAEQGSADGQYAVGTMNFYGQGMARNYEEAIRWYQESARQGHRDSQYNLGVMYMSGLGTERNPTVALTWFTMAADNGSVDAQYNSALMYASGQGTERDMTKARDYFAMAAEQGLRDAQTQLGIIYATADVAEISRDYEQARYWFSRSAHRGDSTAQFFLGRIYADGLGTEQDLASAHMWYEISYRFGYEQAVRAMNRLRSQMNPQQLNQSQLMGLRWMTQYAIRNPGSLRQTREAPDDSAIESSGQNVPVSPVI